MEGGVGILIVLVVLLAVVIRLVAGGMDRDRVGDYIRSRGGKVLSQDWEPFGPGWWGEKDSRIYRVRYADAEGNVHQAACKTSFWSGVYFTEDSIVARTTTALPEGSPADALGRMHARSLNPPSPRPTPQEDPDRDLFEQVAPLPIASPPPPASAEPAAVAPPEEDSPTPQSLLEENRRLRAEIERLKRQQQTDGTDYP